MFYSNPYRRTSVSSGGKNAATQAEGGCGRAGWVFKFESFNQVVEELRRFGEVGCVSLDCAHFIVSGGGIEAPSKDGRCRCRVDAENANTNEEYTLVVLGGLLPLLFCENSLTRVDALTSDGKEINDDESSMIRIPERVNLQGNNRSSLEVDSWATRSPKAESQ
jgi:hypothetical protein